MKSLLMHRNCGGELVVDAAAKHGAEGRGRGGLTYKTAMTGPVGASADDDEFCAMLTGGCMVIDIWTE